MAAALPGPWRRGVLIPPDYTLRIAPLKLELAPGRTVTTLAYNGTVPGPLLRVREGVPIAIDLVNDTDHAEFVHWHGLNVPADVDGSMEEGTPPAAPHGTQRYTFTPRPAGSRWYHTHAIAGRDLHRGTYTGQFGFLLIEGSDNPGRFDQELFLALRDWDPFIMGGDDGFLSVGYNHCSINDRCLGAGDPVRVKQGDRVLMHFLNASASEAHWVAFAGHRFDVVALDGNALSAPVTVDQLRLDPGERIDAVVHMDAPGVWILGETREPVRRAGLGVVVEYAGQSGAPQWRAPSGPAWSYLPFSSRESAPDSSAIVAMPLVFRSVFRGHGDFEHWSINGNVYPHGDVVSLINGRRYRLACDNKSTEDHPVHLHRHSMDVTRIDGKAVSGIRKDVVVVPAGAVVEMEFTANNPGKTLFHCHLQDHMDAGFMMLLDYR